MLDLDYPHVVYKYRLAVGANCIKLPKYAKLLSVQVQKEPLDAICLWALVDPNEKTLEERVFAVVPTGAAIPFQNGAGHQTVLPSYVGTVLEANGALVWHVFEYNSDNFCELEMYYDV